MGPLRPTCPRPSRSRRCSRIVHEPSFKHFEGWHLTVPRVTDRPRLFSWSSLYLVHRRSLTPFVISVGTVLSVPEPTGSWREPRLATNLVFTYVDRDPHLKDPYGAMKHESGRLPSCRNRPGCPDLEPRTLPWVESVNDSRTVLTTKPPSRASAHSTECSLASVAPPTRLAAHRASQRAMRWTDFCHLTSSYQYPRIVGSLCIERLRASAIEEPPVPRQCDSLRRAARTLAGDLLRRALSSHRDACSPYL